MRFLPLLFLIACSGSPDEGAGPPVSPNPPSQMADPNPTPSNDNLSAQALAGLSTADLADGTEDKMVTLCSGCSLAMPGEPEHLIEVQGYTLQMCNADCKINYEGDLQANLEALVQ